MEEECHPQRETTRLGCGSKSTYFRHSPASSLFGYKRMRTALGKEGLVVNHKKVRRLMRELQIRSVILKKRPIAGRKPSVLFRNVLNREFSATAPVQKLVTDITYVLIGHDFAYLSVVMDLYNNEIVAWEFSGRNDLKLVMDTAKKLKCRPSLLHSDRGFQYTTQSYAKLLEEKKLTGAILGVGTAMTMPLLSRSSPI